MIAMKACIRRSPSTTAAGKVGGELPLDHEPLESLVMLEQQQGLVEQLVQVGRLAARRTEVPGPAEVEELVHDPGAAMHLALDDVEVFADRRRPGSPRLASIAATQAPMVASGLFTSCMTPAASCPTAASFSLCRIRCSAMRRSVMSSPMVMTWLMAEPSSRIGNLGLPVDPRLVDGLHRLVTLHQLAGLEDRIEFRLELGGGLAGEHVEHPAAQRLVTPQPLGAGLPLAIPEDDAIVAVDHVEPDRQAVDDESW